MSDPQNTINLNLAGGGDTIRKLERASIRDWVLYAGRDGYFTDRDVLDYGCGRKPYQDIVTENGGNYFGFDRPNFPGSTVGKAVGSADLPLRTWGALLVTQVLQYVADPYLFARKLHAMLDPGGVLVITWATCWDEVEKSDLWRFTLQGGLDLLSDAGFHRMTASRRAEVNLSGFRFCLGHGAIAWK